MKTYRRASIVEYNRHIIRIVVAMFIIGVIHDILLSQEHLKVKAKVKEYHEDGTRTYSDWKEFDTRTVSQLPGFKPEANGVELSEYGGRKDKVVSAKGFFYPTKIDNRWWLVDPDGYLFVDIAIVGVKPGTSSNQTKLMKDKFGGEDGWLDQTIGMLDSIGCNGTGNWSDADLLKKSQKTISYTRGLNFMAAYGKIRGGTYQQPGHIGYPNDLIFVFDSGFEKFCDEEGKKAAQYKDEKSLLGYFSDNEMPFPEDALDRYLKLDSTDDGYKAAKAWIQLRVGKEIAQYSITDDDRSEFLGYMSGRYFELVSKALKKYDPNHLYLGCRFHSSVLKKKAIFESAGKYMDVVSVNYYDVWTPKSEQLQQWEAWSGKPVLITEWYAKANDSGMKNESGAGWIVSTQKERGYFYQNFTLALMESKVCVGWHWFKYQDNDPTDPKADPSNKDSNKGIVNNSFVPYQELLNEMKEVNSQVYRLVDYFDQKHTSNGE